MRRKYSFASNKQILIKCIYKTSETFLKETLWKKLIKNKSKCWYLQGNIGQMRIAYFFFLISLSQMFILPEGKFSIDKLWNLSHLKEILFSKWRLIKVRMKIWNELGHCYQSNLIEKNDNETLIKSISLKLFFDEFQLGASLIFIPTLHQ